MPVPAEKSDVYGAIADPTRRRILERLAREGEKNVSELREPFAMSQPAVSKHLRLLRKAGLVRKRTAGRNSFYSLQPEKLREVHGWVAYFEKYWDQKLAALDRYLGDRKSLSE
jgi:DNA-binding transcriptional ArsR family regulator